MSIYLKFLFVSICFYLLPLYGENKLESLRSDIDKWIGVEKTLSSEKIAWDTKHSHMQDVLNLLKKEKEILQNNISEGEKKLTHSDEVRSKQLQRRQLQNKISKTLSTNLSNFEQSLINIKKRLPQPLRKKLSQAYQRFPKKGKQQQIGNAKRLQNLLGILIEIQKFDRDLTLTHEMHEMSDGKEIESKTLYLGLASAYYLRAEDAGYGIPGSTGWRWISQPELLPSIKELFAIHERKTQQKGYLNLPVGGH